jgi:hypothetical protein
MRGCRIERNKYRRRVGGEAELKGGFLGADVVERAGEGFAAVGVALEGFIEEGEQALLEEVETDQGVVGGDGGCWDGRRCGGQRRRGGDWERGRWVRG